MIAILNYGIGNVLSVQRAFRKLRIDSEISNSADQIANADRLVIAGVGHFSACMDHLNHSGLRPAIEKFAKVDCKPVLGICVGMQMLTEYSEEGGVTGLGWVSGRAIKFPNVVNGIPLRVPHVGWDKLYSSSSALFSDLNEMHQYYFTHSYYVTSMVDSEIAGLSHYGIDYVAAISSGNIYGTQFHPEKSHQAGLSVLRNFADKC